MAQNNLAYELKNIKNWEAFQRKEHDKLYLQATYNTVCMLIDEWDNIDKGTLEIMKKKLSKKVLALGESDWVKAKPKNEKFKKVI